MTEAEAKTKLCPHFPHYSKCHASECMMWRWDQIRNPDWRPNNFMSPAPHPMDNEPLTILSKTDGHCGLAGH